MCIVVTENNMRDPQFPVMLSLLSEFRTGYVDGVKVRLGRLQNLMASSCLEHLDFLHHIDPDELDIKVFSELKTEHIGYQTLTDIPVQREVVEDKRDFLVSSFAKVEAAAVICGCIIIFLQASCRLS